jgi:hypothetical protein
MIYTDAVAEFADELRGPPAAWYTGVGSRRTPAYVLAWMRAIAALAAVHRIGLRTGGAPGADNAFLAGACAEDRVPCRPPAVVYRPWDSFNQEELRRIPGAHLARYLTIGDDFQAGEVAQKAHPVWTSLSPAERKLHRRNVHAVLGDPSHPDPSICVVCWTPDGAGMSCTTPITAKTGGTGQALRVAKLYKIAIINLHGFVETRDPLEVAKDVVERMQAHRRRIATADPGEYPPRLYWPTDDDIPF